MNEQKEKYLSWGKARVETDFMSDLGKKINVQLTSGVVNIEHTPTYIALADQMVEAGQAFTVGPVDTTHAPGVGSISVGDMHEASMKAKKVNLDMYTYLEGLYKAMDIVDENLSDDDYLAALDAIVWDFDIEQVFDFQLVF